MKEDEWNEQAKQSADVVFLAEGAHATICVRWPKGGALQEVMTKLFDEAKV